MLRLDRSVGVNHNCWSKKLLPIIRVGAFISVVSFFFLLLFLPKAFPIKRPKNILFELGQLLEGVFYLKMEKHLGFLRKFLLHKKNARSGGSDRQIIHRLYTKLLTLNTLGTKWFWLLSNSWILLVHNSLIQNGCFFNIFHVSLPCHRKYLESKDCVQEPIFFEKPTSNRFKTHT